MARVLYGGSPADFTTDDDGTIIPNAQVTVWTEREGGTQVTDLLDVFSEPTIAVTSDDTGLVLFYGPDGVDRSLWIDSGAGPRLLVRPQPLPRTNLTIGEVTVGSPASASTGMVDDDGNQILDLVLPPVAPNSITPLELADNSVTQPIIAPNSVGNSELIGKSVDGEILANSIRVGDVTYTAGPITSTLGPVAYGGESYHKYPTTAGSWYIVEPFGGEVRIRRGLTDYPSQPYGQEIASADPVGYVFQAEQNHVWIGPKTINATPATSWGIRPIAAPSDGNIAARWVKANAIQVAGATYTGAVNVADYISVGGRGDFYGVVSGTSFELWTPAAAALNTLTLDAGDNLPNFRLPGGVDLRLGQSLVVRASVASGTIAAGFAVRQIGASGGMVQAGIASSASAAQATSFLGVTASQLTTSASTTGYVVVRGVARSVNTSAFAVGDLLYLAASGGFTAVKPTSGPLVEVGRVLTVGSSGSVYVHPRVVSDLGELSDVDIASATVGQYLRRVNGKWSGAGIAYADISGKPTLGTAAATNIDAVGGVVGYDQLGNRLPYSAAQTSSTTGFRHRSSSTLTVVDENWWDGDKMIEVANVAGVPLAEVGIIYGATGVGGATPVNGTFAVLPGRDYTWGIHVRSDAHTGPMRAQIYWWTSAGNVAASTASVIGDPINVAPGLQFIWVTGKSPDNAAFASFRCMLSQGQTMATTSTLRFAGATWHRGRGGSYHRPGVVVNDGLPIPGTLPYTELSGRPTLGTAAAADSTDFATAAQGAKADTAVQPGALGDSASRNVGTTAGTVAAGDDPRFSTAGIPQSIGTTKGDQIVYTAANTPARLPAPADGRVLITDSTQANGWTSQPVGNYLTPAQARTETLTGFLPRSSSTLSVVSDAWDGGSSVIEANNTGATNLASAGIHYGAAAVSGATITEALIPVIPGVVYSWMVLVRSAAHTGNILSTLFWRKADRITDASTPTVVSSTVAVSTNWQMVMVTGKAPADAAFAASATRLTNTGLTPANTLRFAAASFHVGAGGLWTPGGIGVPNLGIRRNPAGGNPQVWDPATSTWDTV